MADNNNNNNNNQGAGGNVGGGNAGVGGMPLGAGGILGAGPGYVANGGQRFGPGPLEPSVVQAVQVVLARPVWVELLMADNHLVPSTHHLLTPWVVWQVCHNSITA